VQVEIELRDGSMIPLESIRRPGYGFITAQAARLPQGGGRRPVGAIARLQLGPPEQHPPFGFSVPAAA
jgi:hypothetical protein